MIVIEDAEKLLECCRKNKGLVYAMFETSVFHDDLYAMEKLFTADVFARLVYSQGEYCHPHSLRAPSLGSYNDWWKKGCPMWYPTHATAYYVGVTHKSFVDVSCQGTPTFDESQRIPNAIGNVFKSEVGLFRTSEGGVSRMIICGSQGEYLEAGRLRGEYAGYDGITVGPTVSLGTRQANSGSSRRLRTLRNVRASRSRVILPEITTETRPVSSETTIATASTSSVRPIAARWRVPEGTDED